MIPIRIAASSDAHSIFVPACIINMREPRPITEQRAIAQRTQRYVEHHSEPSAGTAANSISCNNAHGRFMTTPQIPQRHRITTPDAGRQRHQAGHRLAAPAGC